MASNPQPQPPPPPPPPPPPQQPPPLPGAGAAAGAGAAEPELVSMIVSHLKSQGLFDQFRRDCLADVDTKPAYQNLRQRVDNFVSNHLATHTWSPHLNKNQLRNNIRQQVLKSGMLESGIDRIISQVVDPKINHTFRPQVEKAVHEFLATLNHKEEAGPSTAPSEEKTDASVTVQGVSATAPSGNVASDAMSILETISSLNQEASAARASTENSNPKNNDKVAKRLSSQQSMDGSTDRERNAEDLPDREKAICDLSGEGAENFAKCEDLNELPCQSEEIKNSAKDTNNLTFASKDTSKEIQQESEDQKSKLLDKCDKKPDSSEKGERRKEKKEKLDKKSDHSKKSDDTTKSKEEKQARESEPVKQLVPEKNSNKHKTTESAKETKEENTSVDSDMDALSDITVSSVHTSDLSSFEEESEEETVISDSTEEGEITSDDEEEKNSQSKTKPHANELSDGKAKPVRHAYVRKPFLYSKYFSDSDDERTVEQRRQSIAKEKEERLLRRQINRERLEEKRKQKAAEKTKSLKTGNQNAKGKSGLNLEEPSSRSLESKATGTSIKDVLKEQKFLEKKVALSRKRKRDSRHAEDGCKKKYEPSEEDSKEMQKTNETCEKNSSKELKHNHGKSEISKQLRRLSESVHSTEEGKSDSKVEKEHKRKTSSSLQAEGAQQDSETRDSKRQLDRAEVNTEELQKQKSIFKNEKHPKKDSDTEIQHMRNAAKKEAKSYRDKNEKERTALEDKLSLKHKYKGDGVHKSSEDVELHSSERSLKGEDGGQKHTQQIKVSSDDKSERKSKHRSERKISVTGKDGKNISESTLKAEELLRKENKKDRHLSTEKSRAEYKSKRSLSDSRPQKDSLSASKQLASASHRRSESYSEDKHEIESTNSDCNLKQEDGVHKDRRRSKSLVEDKILLKSKSKSHSKQFKASETELQENLTKQETGQKLDKDKSVEENDSDKQHKSKNEDKVFEESGVEFELVSGTQSTQGSQKDFSHRVKLHSGERGSVKEKSRGDKDLSNSKLERRFSVEGHKSRNLKHSNKEIKKKEESIKLEDKDTKEMDSGHEKVLSITVAMDKKQSKKISCENRKGSISNQDLLGEEKQSASTTESSHAPAPQKSSMNNDDLHSGHEEELMELDLKQTKVQEASNIEGKNIQNSLQATDAEYAAKEKQSLSISNKELKHSLADPEACESQFLPAAEKTVKQEDIPHKEVGALDTLSKQASMDQGPNKQGAYKMKVVYETSGRILLNVPSKDQASEDSRRPKNLKTVINSNSDDVPLAINSSREDAADAKSMDMAISDFTDSLGSDCHILKNDAAQVVYMEQQDSAVLSSVMKDDGDNTTMTDSIEKDNEVPQPDEQTMEDSTAGLPSQEDYDEAAKLESTRGSELKIKEENLMTDITQDCGDVRTKELLKRKERECLNTYPSTKGERSTMMDSVEKNEVHDTDDMIQSSSVLVPERVPEETAKGSVIASGQEGNSVIGMEDKIESNAVGTSAGSSKLSLYSSLQTTPATVIGTSTEKIIESTVMATSTGEENAEGTSHSEKDSDATTTCSEEESEVTVICTSIEADEGFTTGIWVKSSEGGSFVTGADIGECTVAAAEEGGGSVVTEGLAESESFLTSTEGEENGDCTMVDAEESGKDSVNASGVEIEDSVNSAGAEEKDDAVTSAGSEEKRKTSTCVDTGKFESSVSCLGEVESDGAVTSAGTETGEGSTSGDSSGEFRGGVRAGQVKEHEGTVTCTGAEERGHNFIICSVTGTDAHGESTVTGACIAMATNNSATTGTSGDKSEDTVNGESAVTSTGITPEDDAEISVVCTGLEDSNEGFAVCLEAEKCESLMDSTRAKEEANITTVSVGPCDDEGFVTSTGSKEEDEEGEGIVTSTGRGNEENEHASTCTGMESENALICIGTEEGESSIICIVAEQMEAESGVAGTNINKLTVDSMTSAEKEANCGTNCKNDKGIVESSVTSASAADEGALTAHIGTHEGTLIPLDAEECEGPMTSAMAVQEKSPSGAEDEHENAMTSFDSRELDASISSAVPKEDESSLIPADREEKVKGDIISTSTVEESDAPLHSAMDAEEGPLAVARANESGESSMILTDTEDTEVPMPSTATEFKECVHTFSSKQEKDECTMISTSIVEEFEAPMSSAAIEYDGQLPSVKTEEINENAMVSIDMGIYEVPMPSESSAGGDDDDGSHPTASNKEEKDECAMISTSVVEEQVILMSGDVTEEAIQHISDTESKNETVMISTSTAECFEAPVSSVAMQDENKLTASETEGRYEAAVITTSMTEECEIVLISAAPQAESQLIVAEGDEDAIISPNASEECKIVETTATVDEQFGLAAFNADAKSKGSVIFVGECGAPVLRVATNAEDQHAASSIGDKEEGAVITLSTMEECDSLFTFTVIDESQLAAESTEVKDKSEEIFNTANQIECILSTTDPEKSSNPLLLIGRENETHESGVRGESAASQTTVDSEITETDENSVNLMSVDEALCVEISTETAVSPSPSSEASEDDEQAEDVLHEDVTSELSCMISEAAIESETLRNVNYKFNSNLLLESDFSEIRTPLPRAQALSLASANEVTVNTNHGEVTIEAELGEKSDFSLLHVEELYGSDDKTNSVKIDDIGIEVTFQKSNATFNSGNNAALPKLAEELEFESNLRTDKPQQPESPRSEEGYVDLHTKEFQKDLLQRNIALERETFHVENLDTQITEEHRSRGIQCKSSGAMDKEKCNQLIAQDVRKDNEQSQCSKTKPDNIKEVISGDTAEVSKEIDVKHTPPKSTMEEKDEFTIEQEMSEKEKHGLESNENSPEENQPVIVKRKRGRPRKYPLEAVQPGGGESKADMSTGNLQFPIFASRGKTPQTGTDIPNKKETTNEDEAEKAEIIVRKRGRKPRRSLVQSEETETLEPERKRRKLTSSEDELKEQEDGEEEDGEEDDEAHSGATTRSATRLEAQRKQPSKPTTRATSKGSSPSSVSPRKRQNLAAKKRSPSDTKINKSPPLTQLKVPSTKRKREDSPTVVRKKGQQKTEETPVKKAKR
ncbi:biorientation of chromosomes in cell division protein 1-like 1 isoform X1 [Gymnogyps californianus]|uniref:biorientation of chromosomes in cell division protein 1-like 1 isoform X1 n=2 Tax=Gymnogyps californianus TaxID=33616 RepID=UPI0021C5BD50|nr:biorientation of chromosomes in cell division protein 1-like 1 isoform X1 [Gymnogyps californianus]